MINKAGQPIEYIFLNLSQQKFYSDNTSLVDSVGPGGFMQSILFPQELNKCLIVVDNKPFSEIQALLIYRRIITNDKR